MKPFDRPERIVFEGRLEYIPLADIIQMLQVGAKSGVLFLRRDDGQSAVVAFRDAAGRPPAPAEVLASSTIEGYCGERNAPPADACDGDPDTAWNSGASPSAERPAWLLLRYPRTLSASGAHIVPAPGGRITTVVFGGEALDTLFAVCSDRTYKRKVKAKGILTSEPPVKPSPPRL